MRILWNHDLRAPEFWAECRNCGHREGPYKALAVAQGARCTPCGEKDSAIIRQFLAVREAEVRQREDAEREARHRRAADKRAAEALYCPWCGGGTWR